MNLSGTVSLIVPVYNVADYLGKCMESLFAQTYADLQIILIDDGSTDGCAALCDAYAAADDRISVVHKPNGGLASARNAGLAVATGEYLGFIDSDDWVAPDYVEQLLKCLLTNSSDAAFCSCTHVPDPLFSKESPEPVIPEYIGVFSGLSAIKLCLRRGGYYAVWAKLFRLSALRDTGKSFLFREDIKICEDDVWLCEIIPALRSVAAFNTPLYYYVQRPSGLSKSCGPSDPNWKMRWDTAFEAKMICLDLFPDDPELLALNRFRVWDFLYMNTEVTCYYQHCPDIQRYFHKLLHPYRKDFFSHPSLSRKRAFRYRVIEALVTLHAPRKLVRYFVSHSFAQMRRDIQALSRPGREKK